MSPSEGELVLLAGIFTAVVTIGMALVAWWNSSASGHQHNANGGVHAPKLHFHQKKNVNGAFPASAPDLYQCNANDLDTYIADHLQPDKVYLSQVKAAVNTICDFLKENCYRNHPNKIKVDKVVKGGSAAKGTALKQGSGADLVIFPNCIENYSDQESKRKGIIEEIRKKLEECQKENTFEVIFKETNLDNPCVLSFELQSKTGGEFIEFDILPAYNALGQITEGYKPDPKVYVKLIENWKPGDNFSPCFTELQRDFIRQRPPKVKSLIRLVKHWYKTKLEGKKLPPKYALELLVIYAWEKCGTQQRFNMAQTFRNFLELICNYQDLCVYWTNNYELTGNAKLADFLRKQLEKPRPVILDPADPTGNLGEGYNWEKVADEAENCLSKMYSGTSQFKDIPPTLPEQLISQRPRRNIPETPVMQPAYSGMEYISTQAESNGWSCTIM